MMENHILKHKVLCYVISTGGKKRVPRAITLAVISDLNEIFTAIRGCFLQVIVRKKPNEAIFTRSDISFGPCNHQQSEALSSCQTP